MDVRSMSPERSRELADLRRRAYGPSADIARDPAALARLHELEDQIREEEPVNAVPQEPAVREKATAAEAPVVAEPRPPVVAPAPARPLEQDVAQPAAQPPAEKRAWWRRIPIWVIALASAAVGALIAVSAINLAADRPDATLTPATLVPETPADWDEQVRGWDLDPSTTQSFGDFRQIDVWGVRSRIGAPCVMLSSRGRPFAIGCASQDLDPVVDFTVKSGMLGILNDQLRDGMLLRFIVREDHVDVWVREAPARETQSLDRSPLDTSLLGTSLLGTSLLDSSRTDSSPSAP